MSRRCTNKCPGHWRGRCALDKDKRHKLCICDFAECSCHSQRRYMEELRGQTYQPETEVESNKPLV